MRVDSNDAIESLSQKTTHHLLADRFSCMKRGILPHVAKIRRHENDPLCTIAAKGFGGVMHCFGGTLEHAHASLDLGFILSFAGNITYPRAQNIRDAAGMVPLDSVFIETDSPYLAPVPHRGKRNEPAFVTEVARQISHLRGLSAEEVGEQTTRNFKRFFRIH